MEPLSLASRHTVRGILLYILIWLVLLLALNRPAAAICGPVDPLGCVPEMEPNDDWGMAMALPMGLPVYGEQSLQGDSDWFELVIPPMQDLSVELQMDFLNLRLRLWGIQAGPPVLLQEVDEGAFCQGEVLNWGFDPCLEVGPISTLMLEVSQVAALDQGNYRLVVMPGVPTSVPLGDCRNFALPVDTNPYSDSQDTATGFRDRGFGSAPDVWYQLSLEHAGLLVANTCAAATDFDTVIRVVAADGSTVLASNDDSPVCTNGGGRSWVSTCLGSGTYYVVVEGAGGASGIESVRITTTPTGSNARLIAGDWGTAAEPWHRWFSRENSVLWLLADDPCGTIQEVSFLAREPGGSWLPLGTDTDGSETRMATAPDGETGDGWRLVFNPDQLPIPPVGGEVEFQAQVTFADGSLQSVECSSSYVPALDPASLVPDIARYQTVHDNTLLVSFESLLPWEYVELRWSLCTKQDEWSRSVPPEWQRPVSDSHCSPTAAAACLEWLDATYGTNVTCGLSGEDLVRALGETCNTNVGGPGTAHSDFFNGLQNWIDDCGGGYTVHRDDGSVAGMQDQGESQGQDVITTLEWDGGGAHSVTLSSIHNDPNEDGTITMDFMDPWTGNTQYGDFNPATGTFSGYGDTEASGTIGPVYYVCPVENGPGDGGDGSGGSGWGPFPTHTPFPIPMPDGRWFLKMTVVTQSGHALDLFSIVERQQAESPVVRLHVSPAQDLLQLSWLPVRDALAYEVYQLDEPWGGGTLLTRTTQTSLDLALEAAPSRAFYRVVTVYAH
ncbi:MAG: hypothetical protein KC488_00985 [Candidatus Cloacimonetes bacterium]|nr:hypothetical protein [Candidatus Cloacimonadota bacterium]